MLCWRFIRFIKEQCFFFKIISMFMGPLFTPPSNQLDHSWNPPIYSHLKINFDGATFNNLGAVGLRVVMCNSIGYVIGAMCENVSLPTSSVVVEALACRRVLVFAKELCVSECSIEGDVEVIINAS